jgi:hypothetical protein
MNAKTLGVVALGAVVLAGAAAVVVTRSQQSMQSQEFGGLLFPQLGSKANDAATIAINAGGTVTTLEKKSGTWHYAEKNGYPVNIEKIKEVVVGLSQLKELEPKTSKPDRYAEIGVEEPPTTAPPMGLDGHPQTASQATRITIKDASGTTLASALIGKQRYGTPPSVFVRKDGEAQSWLAQGSIDIPRTPIAWFDPQISAVEHARLKQVTVTQPGESTAPLVINRPTGEDAPFHVASLPEGRELKTPTAADPTATALTFMSFDDLRPAGEIIPADGAGLTTYRAETFDGLVITAKVIEKDGKTWAAFEAAVDEASLPPATPPAPAEGAVQPAVPTKTAQEVRDEVAGFNKRHAGWAYAIVEYKARSLRTTMAELLADPAPASGPQGPGMEEAPPQPENPQPAPDGPLNPEPDTDPADNPPR